MGWAFVWMMFVLKIPIAALLYLVWWAIHQTEEPPAADEDGGVQPPHRPRADGPTRRRGPHGDPALTPPAPRARPPLPARARTRDG